MTHRSLIAVLVAAGSLPGCGLAMRKLAGEPLLWVWTDSTSHPEPPHRVALATLEAMRAELASADFAKDQNSQFSVASELMQPGMKVPRPGDPLPPDYPAFWVDWNAKGDGHREQNLVLLLQAHFDGLSMDGQAVQVNILRSRETIVTIRVGKHGNARVGKALGAKIEERLAHPLHPPGSPEEAETLRAFFGGVESREQIPSLRKPEANARG